MKKIIKNKYIDCTILAIIIYIIYLKIMKIYPLGENSILKSDLYQQYVNFLCYLREVILNGKSIIISWNLGLANYFYTTFAYYLVSPINVLVVFFDSSNMDICVELITLIKIVLIANFFVLFLEKSYGYKKIETILFGLIYAYSSYVICYSFHIMWLDCVYMLPIILIFVDKYLETGTIWPLTLSLSYAILTNYYIGYIVAFFTGIYFLAKMFIKGQSIKTLFKFMLAIITSFGIGMIVILPSIMQLKGNMHANVDLIKIDLDSIKLFANVLFNNYVYAFTQKSCFMFSSTLVILLVPMYFFNSKIKTKEKLTFIAIIIFLLLPVISPFLNKLWHAFTTPNCFNYRYSFTLIFVLILIAARELQNKEYSKKVHFAVSVIFFSVLTIIEIILNYKGYLKADNFNVTMKSIFSSVLVYGIIFILTYILFYHKNIKFFKEKNNYKKVKSNIVWLGLGIVIMADLLIAAKSGQNNNDIYFKREYFLQYNSIMNHLKNKLKTPEIERIVFESDGYGSNMSLRFGYSNIGFFTSARNRNILKSMYKLGYNVQMDEQLWITSYSGTFLNYDIAGVKYYVSKNKFDDNEIFGFEFDEKYDDYYIYKNKNSFNVGYYMADNIEEKNNPFEMQNDFLDKLYYNKNLKERDSENINESQTDNNANIDGFVKNENNIKNVKEDNNGEEKETKKQEEKKVRKNRENGKEEKKEDKRVDNINRKGDVFFEKIENSHVLVCNKEKQFNGEKNEQIIKYKVKANKNCNIYLQSDFNLQLYIDGKAKFQDYSNIWGRENGIKQIKKLEKDEEFEFIIKAKENLENIYVYVSNNEEIQKVFDKKDVNGFKEIEIMKNGLKGVANFNENGYLVFSIAYDKCWEFYVDGKKVKKEAIAGCFLGTKLVKGKHYIEIKADKII